MSVKICNGYMIPKGIAGAISICEDFRKQAISKTEEIIASYVINLGVEIVDRITIGEDINEISSLLKTSFDGYNDQITFDTNTRFGAYCIAFKYFEAMESLYKIRKEDCFFNFDSKIILFPLSKRKTLALFYSQQEVISDMWRFNTYVKEYDYWNNTDKPEDISTREWSQRQKDWDKALLYKNNGIASINGITINCYSGYHNHAPIFGTDMVKKIIPPFDKRCFDLAEKILIDLKYKEFSAIQKDFSWSEIYKNIDEWLNTDVGKKELTNKIAYLQSVLKQDLEWKDFITNK